MAVGPRDQGGVLVAQDPAEDLDVHVLRKAVGRVRVPEEMGVEAGDARFESQFADEL